MKTCPPGGLTKGYQPKTRTLFYMYDAKELVKHSCLQRIISLGLPKGPCLSSRIYLDFSGTLSVDYSYLWFVTQCLEFCLDILRPPFSTLRYKHLHSLL